MWHERFLWHAQNSYSNMLLGSLITNYYLNCAKHHHYGMGRRVVFLSSLFAVCRACKHFSRSSWSFIFVLGRSLTSTITTFSLFLFVQIFSLLLLRCCVQTLCLLRFFPSFFSLTHTIHTLSRRIECSEWSGKNAKKKKKQKYAKEMKNPSTFPITNNGHQNNHTGLNTVEMQEFSAFSLSLSPIHACICSCFDCVCSYGCINATREMPKYHGYTIIIYDRNTSITLGSSIANGCAVWNLWYFRLFNCVLPPFNWLPAHQYILHFASHGQRSEEGERGRERVFRRICHIIIIRLVYFLLSLKVQIGANVCMEINVNTLHPYVEYIPQHKFYGILTEIFAFN